MPSLIQDPRSEVSRCFLEIAGKLAGQLSIASEQAKKDILWDIRNVPECPSLSFPNMLRFFDSAVSCVGLP